MSECTFMKKTRGRGDVEVVAQVRACLHSERREGGLVKFIVGM